MTKPVALALGPLLLFITFWIIIEDSSPYAETHRRRLLYALYWTFVMCLAFAGGAVGIAIGRWMGSIR